MLDTLGGASLSSGVRHMIFAFEQDDHSLHLFASLAEAESHFEAIDVENGEYEFCDDQGQRFTPEIIVPVTAFGAGRYRLRESGTRDPSIVASFISRAKFIAKGCAGMQYLGDLEGT